MNEAELKKRLAWIKGLHFKMGSLQHKLPRCGGCGHIWPCRTYRAAKGDFRSTEEYGEEFKHLGGNANAEDCMRCSLIGVDNLPYPFICPGKDPE